MRLTASLTLLALLTACTAEPDPLPSGDPDVDADQDGFTADEDCDDSNAAIFPGAVERCNGLDDDCDADVDEEAEDGQGWYRDADSDGYGSGDPVQECDGLTGYVDNDGDCDDRLATVHPEGREIPADGIDNDCVDGDAGVVIYVVTFEGLLTALDRETGETLWTHDLGHQAIDVAVGPDGAIYVTQYEAGGIVVVDPETRETRTLIAEGLWGLHGLTFDHAQGDLVVTTNRDRVVSVDPATSSVTELLAGRGETLDAVRLPGTDQLWVASRSDRSLRVLDTARGQLERIAVLDWAPTSLSVSTRGTLLVASQEGAMLEVDPTGSVVRRVAVQPDARWQGHCVDVPTGDRIVVNHSGAVVVMDADFGRTESLATVEGTGVGCASDWPVDADGDGSIGVHAGGRDCDDTDASMHPGAEDLAIDGIDFDCDGIDGLDADGDGAIASIAGGLDCDDEDASVYPGTTTCRLEGLQTCRDVLEVTPRAQTGVHALDVRGSGVEAVWCDMDVSGGGWTLVGRSLDGCEGTEDCVWNARAELGLTPGHANIEDPFGWDVAAGHVEDLDAPYSLDADHLVVDELLIGHATGGAWGDVVYQVPVPRDFPRGYRAQEFRSDDAFSVRGPCEDPGVAFRYVGVATSGKSFYFSGHSDAGEPRPQGLNITGFLPVYFDPGCEGDGLLTNWSGMIAVR